ncbi:unnamed protein product, partial [Closterium sp. Yama58-4]
MTLGQIRTLSAIALSFCAFSLAFLPHTARTPRCAITPLFSCARRPPRLTARCIASPHRWVVA